MSEKELKPTPQGHVPRVLAYIAAMPPDMEYMLVRCADMRLLVSLGVAGEVWWLIEWPRGHRGDAETGWWTGREAGTDRFSWDVEQAVRFRTKADAEKVMSAAGMNYQVVATDHRWVRGPTEDEKAAAYVS